MYCLILLCLMNQIHPDPNALMSNANLLIMQDSTLGKYVLTHQQITCPKHHPAFQGVWGSTILRQVRSINLPFPTGGVLWPQNLCIDTFYSKVYVISGYDMKNVAVCDYATGKAMRVIHMDGCIRFICHNPMFNKIYCAMSENNALQVIDCENDNIVHTISLQDCPYALAWNSINNELYVTYDTLHGIDVFDCFGDTLICRIPANAHSLWGAMLHNPLMNKIYRMISGFLTVIDGNSHTVIKNFFVGADYGALALNYLDNKLYIASQMFDSIKIINCNNDSVIARYPSGDGRKDIAFNPVMDRIYVNNYNGGLINVLDGVTNQMLPSIYLGDYPWAITYDSIDNRLFAISQGNDIHSSVYAVDCRTQNIISILPAGDFSRGIVWNKYSNRILVANTAYNNSPSYTIDVYAADSFRHLFDAAIGYAPYKSYYNPTTNRNYIISGADRYIAIVDHDQRDTCYLRPIDEGPWDVLVNTAVNKIYIANRWANRVAILDGVTDSIVAWVGTGIEPVMFALNQTNNKIYCNNLMGNSVTVIDGSTNSYLRTIQVGIRPIPILWNPLSNKIYVGNADDHTISIIDGVSDTVIATVSAGNFTWSMAFNSVNNKIYCANAFDTINAVTVIDDATNLPIGYLKNDARPYALAYNPINNKIYCTDMWGGGVNVFDGAGDTLLEKVPIPNSRPYSLLYNPRTNTVFCAYVTQTDPPWFEGFAILDGETNAVKYNYITNSEAWYIGHGSSPRIFSYDSVNNRVYFNQYYASKILAIDGDIGIMEKPSSKRADLTLDIFPNPSYHFAVIKYYFKPTEKDARLRIYDLAGRLIKKYDLLPSSASPLTSITWDCHDEQGRAVPAGVYFVKADGADGMSIKKIVLLK